MIQHRLLDELDKVTARYRHLWFWQALAAAWLVAAAAGLAVLALRSSISVGSLAIIPLLVVGALGLAVAGVWLVVRAGQNPLWTARQIESAFPELRTCLLAAVEQRPDLPDGRFGYLQANVIHQALLHAQRQHWEEIVPTRRIAWAMAANAATFALLVAVFAPVPRGQRRVQHDRRTGGYRDRERDEPARFGPRGRRSAKRSDTRLYEFRGRDEWRGRNAPRHVAVPRRSAVRQEHSCGQRATDLPR
jgi:hypothetical protein